MEPGETKKFGEDSPLRAGIYTVEQLAAPDGYQLQLGERVQPVGLDGNTDKEGHFHINGTPGRLTLTAGGAQGDGMTHYYTLERTEPEEGDTSEFEKRIISLSSGEDYVLDNLPKGGYTVKEYTIDAVEQFTVTTSQTAERDRSGKSTGIQKKGEGRNWRSFNFNGSDTNPDYKNFDVDYIQLKGFGPLYNANDKTLSSAVSYDSFKYGVSKKENISTITDIHTHKTGYWGHQTISIKNAPVLTMTPHKRLWCLAVNVSGTTSAKIGVKWTEYDEKDATLTFRNANLAQTFTTDGRKETVITAPKLPNPDADKAEEIAYPYTIQSVPPKSTETAGKAAQEQEEPPQQQETRTIRLLPGESQGIQLPAGSYTITETIQGPVEQIGFTMKVAGHPFGTTEANQKFEVQIGGRRTLTISKPAALLPGQAEDNRTYSFWVFGELVELRAGESKTVTLPTEGSYTITPHNDSLDTYQLNYTDSGAIYGTASGSTGSVTFTNSFSQGEYAYRYIHEYYVKKADGSYQHEGRSAITTVRGRSKGEIYQAGNIRKDTSHNGVEYIHFDESYGWVTPLSPESSVNVKEDTEARSAQNAPPFSSEYQGILSEGTGTANTDTGTRQIAYAPVAGWTESRVTTDARELIILRYYRQPSADPPDDPPDTPNNPPKLTELPDPNDPGSSEEITIWEDGVPKTYIKIWQPEEEEWVYIPAEDVPLGQTPKTGDPNSTGLWMLLALCSLTGLGMLALRPGRKE